MHLGKRFTEFLDRRVEGFGGAQYKTFGIFGVINYPLGYLFLHLLGADESAAIRLLAALMSLPLIFIKYWPPQLKKYLNLYWFITLLYCLPVFGVYSLLKNHASTEWLLNFSLGLFLLFLLVDYILLLVIYSLGTFLGYLIFILTGQEVIFQQGFPANFMYIYGCIIVIGCLFSRNKERLENERFQAIKAVAGAVAHEMRTPLSSVTGIAKGLKRKLPALIKHYNLTEKDEKNSKDLEQQIINLINETTYNIEHINRQAFAFINMLLMNLKEDFPESKLTSCSIQTCIRDAIQHYPFNGQDQKLVSYDTNTDFEFKGNSLFIKHILFNLLKNSIYYIRTANKGHITITPRIEKGFNKLYFRDTGSGIPSHIIPHVFDRFYSKTKYGTGIGLAFCKMVMENLGGDITCHSVEGEYTEFILSFPVIS